MSSRAILELTKLSNQDWLQWSFWPRPYSDMIREDLLLCPLYDCEADLKYGRFTNFKPIMFEHQVEFRLPTNGDQRQRMMTEILDWIRTTNCEWNLLPLTSKPASLLFMFEDTTIAYMFMLNYGWD